MSQPSSRTKHTDPYHNTLAYQLQQASNAIDELRYHYHQAVMRLAAYVLIVVGHLHEKQRRRHFRYGK